MQRRLFGTLALAASACVEVTVPPESDAGAPVETPDIDAAASPATDAAECEPKPDGSAPTRDAGHAVDAGVPDASGPRLDAATLDSGYGQRDSSTPRFEAGADATSGPGSDADAARDGASADANTNDAADGFAGDADAGSDGGLECYRLQAHARGNFNEKFAVGAVVDQYWNFGFQSPWTGTVYGVVFRPVVDNAQAVKEVWVYREPVEHGSVLETIGQHSGGELIYGWGPGGEVIDFRAHPDDVGVELTPATYSLEIHYDSADLGARDTSGLEVCVTRTRPINLASLSWLGHEQGGAIAFASGLCLEPETHWTGVCQPEANEPIHLLFLTPRMRGTGRRMTATIIGPNGSRVLHDRPFDVADQRTYQTQDVLMPGEAIITSCMFAAPNCAGQATTQERCHLLTYAWPARALEDRALEGTLIHGAGACLGQ